MKTQPGPAARFFVSLLDVRVLLVVAAAAFGVFQLLR